ncbi:MAG: HAD family hydrolase [Planctomycetota bacterium]|jgi:putative hydrolase of the HAD superfamily
MAQIEAVIFDWGGVLIEDPGPPMISYISDVLGVQQRRYMEIQRPFVADFRTGKIAERVFWQRLCGGLDVEGPREGSLWGTAFEKAYKPKADMFDLARRLKRAGFKIALLSNTELPAVDFFSRQQYDFLDAAVFSCLEGTKKPERQIYEAALKAVGCSAEQAAFIDDREGCVEGAKAIGLNAILFRNIEQVKAELERLGVEAN